MILEHCDTCCTITDSRRDGACKKCGTPRSRRTEPDPRQLPLPFERPSCRGMLALVGLALMGCASRAPLPSAYEVHVSPSWYADTPVILEALSDWTAATGVELAPVVTDDACAGACFSIRPASLVQVETYNPLFEAVTVGADGPAPVVLVPPGFEATNPALFLHIVRHEIGHAIGLSHVADEGAVMYPNFLGSPTITDNDIAQYRSLR